MYCANSLVRTYPTSLVSGNVIDLIGLSISPMSVDGVRGNDDVSTALSLSNGSLPVFSTLRARTVFRDSHAGFP